METINTVSESPDKIDDTPPKTFEQSLPTSQPSKNKHEKMKDPV